MKERIKRINGLIKEVLSQIVFKQTDFEGVLVTLTRVETEKDLKKAKVFVSIIPEKMEKEVFEILKKKKNYFRHLLGKKVFLKKIPEIEFLIDKGEKKAQKIIEILEKIKK
jgi:ribosome-binding factor A